MCLNLLFPSAQTLCSSSHLSLSSARYISIHHLLAPIDPLTSSTRTTLLRLISGRTAYSDFWNHFPADLHLYHPLAVGLRQCKNAQIPTPPHPHDLSHWPHFDDITIRIRSLPEPRRQSGLSSSGDLATRDSCSCPKRIFSNSGIEYNSYFTCQPLLTLTPPHQTPFLNREPRSTDTTSTSDRTTTATTIIRQSLMADES